MWNGGEDVLMNEENKLERIFYSMIPFSTETSHEKTSQYIYICFVIV